PATATAGCCSGGVDGSPMPGGGAMPENGGGRSAPMVGVSEPGGGSVGGGLPPCGLVAGGTAGGGAEEVIGDFAVEDEVPESPPQTRYPPTANTATATTPRTEPRTTILLLPAFFLGLAPPLRAAAPLRAGRSSASPTSPGSSTTKRYLHLGQSIFLPTR